MNLIREWKQTYDIEDLLCRYQSGGRANSRNKRREKTHGQQAGMRIEEEREERENRTRECGDQDQPIPSQIVQSRGRFMG